MPHTQDISPLTIVYSLIIISLIYVGLIFLIKIGDKKMLKSNYNNYPSAGVKGKQKKRSLK